MWNGKAGPATNLRLKIVELHHVARQQGHTLDSHKGCPICKDATGCHVITRLDCLPEVGEHTRKRVLNELEMLYDVKI